MQKLYSAILLFLLLTPAVAQLSADWTFDAATATYAPGEFGTLSLKLSLLAPGDANIQDYQVSNIRTLVDFPAKVAGDLRKESTAVVKAGTFLSVEHAFSIDPSMDEGSYPFRVIIYYDEQYTDLGNNACCQQVKVANSKSIITESPTRSPNYIRVIKPRQGGTLTGTWAQPAGTPVLDTQLQACQAQTEILQQKYAQSLAELNSCSLEVSTYNLANKILTIVATLTALIGGLIILALTAVVLFVLFLSFCALGLLLCVGAVAGFLVGLVVVILFIKIIAWLYRWVMGWFSQPKHRRASTTRGVSRARRRARSRARRKR